MDRPNKMASVTTGRKASTGPACPRPNAPVPQPHWKNAVSTPNDAAAASRFITAAVAGISRLRNATASSKKLSPMMARMNHGSFAFTTAAKSANVAVTPPTYARIVVPRSAAGMMSLRNITHLGEAIAVEGHALLGAMAAGSGEQFVDAAEVVEDQCLIHSGRSGDGPGRGAGDAALGQDLQCSGEQFVLRAGHTRVSSRTGRSPAGIPCSATSTYSAVKEPS